MTSRKPLEPSTDAQLEDYLTIEGAAARRGCSAATIWRRIKKGELQVRRILGRTVLSVEEVDRLKMPAGGGRWNTSAK